MSHWSAFRRKQDAKKTPFEVLAQLAEIEKKQLSSGIAHSGFEV
jgi:hypothetical protein